MKYIIEKVATTLFVGLVARYAANQSYTGRKNASESSGIEIPLNLMVPLSGFNETSAVLTVAGTWYNFSGVYLVELNEDRKS